MAKIITSLLLPIQRLIGSPSLGAVTVLDDDSVIQTLPVVPEIARRGLSGPTGGWFLGILENVHSGADEEASDIDPYNPGAAAPGAWPDTVPNTFDVWLMGISGMRTSGAGALTMAVIGWNSENTQATFAWGKDDAGDPVAPSTPPQWLARFDSVEENIGTLLSTAAPLLTEQGLVYQPMSLRLPRSGVLTFFTESGGAAEFQAHFIMGLFPEGMGQDIHG